MCRQQKWRAEQKKNGRCVQCPRKARAKRVKGVVRTLALCRKCSKLNAARAADHRAKLARNLTVREKAVLDAAAGRRNSPRSRSARGKSSRSK